jgi:hypothetical protein
MRIPGPCCTSDPAASVRLYPNAVPNNVATVCLALGYPPIYQAMRSVMPSVRHHAAVVIVGNKSHLCGLSALG